MLQMFCFLLKVSKVANVCFVLKFWLSRMHPIVSKAIHLARVEPATFSVWG